MAIDLLDATAEELDNAHLYEIIDGVKVEMPPMSAESTILAARLSRLLANHGDSQNHGEAYPEVLIRLPLERERNRRPDVVYVPYSRWARNRPIPRTNAWDVLPSLCVEVVSPTDLVEELSDKIDEYFRAGVSQVWVIYPRLQLVYMYTSLTTVRGLTRTDTLDGGDVLPGFTLALTDLFPESEAETNGEV
jgi:Uma2 family endonuclease